MCKLNTVNITRAYECDPGSFRLDYLIAVSGLARDSFSCWSAVEVFYFNQESSPILTCGLGFSGSFDCWSSSSVPMSTSTFSILTVLRNEKRREKRRQKGSDKPLSNWNNRTAVKTDHGGEKIGPWNKVWMGGPGYHYTYTRTHTQLFAPMVLDGKQSGANGNQAYSLYTK